MHMLLPLLAAALVVLAGASMDGRMLNTGGTPTTSNLASPSNQIPPTSADMLALIDSESPGFGADSYFKEDHHHAMAYGLIASAAVNLERMDLATTAADWLVAHRNGGWGLGFAWDAFADGSTNPADTVYGITVALCVQGLLDAHDLTHNVHYLSEALAALDAYWPYFTETPEGGFFHYSDQPQDAKDTHNVSAMLAAQYARAAVAADRSDYRERAAKTFSHLWSVRIEADGETYWPYSSLKSQPNDAVHAAYIVHALKDGQRYSAFDQDISPAAAHLRRFLRNNRVMHMPFPTKRDNPARGWGSGMLIATLATTGHRETAEEMYRTLSLTEEFYVRHLAHMLYAASIIGR